MSQATKTLPNTKSYGRSSAGDTPELSSHQSGDSSNSLDALRRAMESTRGSDATAQLDPNNRDQYLNQLPPEFFQKQQHQAELEKKAKRVRELNSARNQESVFNQTIIKAEQETKARLESTRREIKMMGRQVVKPQSQIDLALAKQIVNPGTEGKSDQSFLDKLAAGVQLMLKIHESQQWAEAASTKRAKRGPGSNMIKNSTKSVQDSMHHEVAVSTQGA